MDRKLGLVKALGVMVRLREEREAEESERNETGVQERETSELRKLSERKSKRRLW